MFLRRRDQPVLGLDDVVNAEEEVVLCRDRRRPDDQCPIVDDADEVARIGGGHRGGDLAQRTNVYVRHDRFPGFLLII